MYHTITDPQKACAKAATPAPTCSLRVAAGGARLQEGDALLGLGVEERDALLEAALVRLPRLQQRGLAHCVAAARRQRRHRAVVFVLRSQPPTLGRLRCRG